MLKTALLSRQLIRPAVARQQKLVFTKPLFLQQAVSIRHNSSSAVSEEVANAASKFDTSLAFDQVTATAEKVSSTLSSDQFGYLKSVGLNDGWWPSDLVQQALELVHVTTGLPWWLTIIVTTIGIRLAFFPVFVKASDNMARSQEIMPTTRKIQKEIAKARASGEQNLVHRKSMQLRLLNQKHGIKQRWTFASPVLQMTYSIGSFLGIREMSNLPVQGFETGGAYWFTDLAGADPYLGLQIISACVYSLSMKLGGDTAMSQFSGNAQKIFIFLPFASVAFTYNLSAGVLVYFAANGFFSVLQGRLLRSPAFRNALKMHPLPDPAMMKNQPGMLDNIKETYAEMQNNSNASQDKESRAREAVERQLSRAKSNRVIVKKRK